MATSSGFSFDQSFNSDDEDAPQFVPQGRNASVFVIDCSLSMFQDFIEDEDPTNLFLKCLTVLERLLLNKIISNNKDLVGVVMYNTAKSPDPDGNMKMDNPLVCPANCAILIPLKQVEPSMIQYVKNLKNSDDFMDFDNKFGHSKDAKIADILWLCSSMISSCGKQIHVPQILWYTDDDLPHQLTSSDGQQAFQKAKDFQQLQIDFQFFPMKVDFDGDLFYKELICLLLDIDPADVAFPTPQLNEKVLLQRMFRRAYNKRATVYMTVEISEKAKFGVGVYGFARQSSIPRPVLLSRDTNEEIVSSRGYKVNTIDPEAEIDSLINARHFEANRIFKEKLEPSMTIKYQQCGGEKIRFTPLEAYEIKQVMEPKIKVLGFKPSSILNTHNHIKCPYFIYPSDNLIMNSSVFFRALWSKCLADDKVVICLFTMKLKSMPKLVALVPQEQSAGSDGEVLRYDGFRLEFIPFAGDLRDLSEVFADHQDIDENISNCFKKLASKLRVNLAPTMFDNPVVTKIFAKIEEQVFDEQTEVCVDAVTPNLQSQDDRISDIIDELEELLGGFEEEGAKRKATDTTGGQRKKVTTDDVNLELVLEKCKSGNIKDLTVSTLKSYLELKLEKGLSKLNKAALIERILQLDS